MDALGSTLFFKETNLETMEKFALEIHKHKCHVKKRVMKGQNKSATKLMLF